MEPSSSPVGVPAGFWRRFAASFVDGLVFFVIGIAVALVGVQVGPARWLSLLISAFYFTYFHGRTGQTPGDAALGIQVVDLRDRTGRPIGYGRAFGRWAVSLVSGLALLLGYLWMLWDPELQTWHDRAAGSLPVHVRR